MVLIFWGHPVLRKWPAKRTSVLQRVKADECTSGVQTQTLRECELTRDALLAGAISDGSCAHLSIDARRG